MASIGYIAHPTLDGEQLVSIDPVDFEVTADQGVVVHRLATGRYRKTVHFTSAKLPDVQVLHSFKLDYARMTPQGNELYLNYIDLQLSRPGIHTFTIWKYVRLSWTVTTGQDEFFLPWRPANFAVALPSEDPSGGKVKPIISTSPLPGSDFVIIPKTGAAYDSATPGVGEACIDTEGTRFRVGDTLSTGSVVYGTFVPLFNVLLSLDNPRKLMTGKEGRVWVIQEI